MQESVNRRPDVRFTRSCQLILIAIFASAIAVRIGVVILAPTTPSADAATYHRLAIGLAEGRGYVDSDGNQTAWAPPGYPLVLSIIYRIAGPSVTFATLFQAFIGAITVLGLVLFGSAVIGWRAAIVAGFIAALYPVLVWLPRLLMTENLSLPLLLFVLWSAAMFLKTKKLWWLILLGGVGGFSTLVRGGNLFIVVAIGLGIVASVLKHHGRDWQRTTAGLLLAGAVFCLVLAPWTARNFRVFGRFVPIATQEGLTFYSSYWPPVKNGKRIWGTLPRNEDPAVAAAVSIRNEADASAHFKQLTISRLREQPGLFFRLIPAKMASLLVPLDWELLPHSAGTTRSLNVGYVLLVLPALFGFVILIRNPQPYQWLLWVIPLAVLVQTVLFYGSPRFRLPAELIAILLAATGLTYAWAFFKKRRTLLR